MENKDSKDLLLAILTGKNGNEVNFEFHLIESRWNFAQEHHDQRSIFHMVLGTRERNFMVLTPPKDAKLKGMEVLRMEVIEIARPTH